MFGTTVDTAIGLVLIFFLFSVLVSTAMEIISSFGSLRSKALENAIAKLVENPNGVKSNLFSMFGAHTRAADDNTETADTATADTATADTATADTATADTATANTETANTETANTATADTATADTATADTATANTETANTETANTATANTETANTATKFDYRAVWRHPLVQGASGNDRPSYVSAANFTVVVIEELVALSGAAGDLGSGIRALPPGDFRRALQSLYDAAGKDLEKFRTAVETWFDGAMDRLTGEYKRFTQAITFAVALLMAIALNVDTLHIAQTIYAEPTLRASLEAAAEQQAKAPPPATASNAAVTNAIANFQAAQSEIETVLPLGWSAWPELNVDLAFQIVGWLLTALAAMLGGPFWFDLLKTFVNVRNAGPKPASSTSDAK